MADSNPAALRQRLRDLSFSLPAAHEALRGVAVPSALGRRATRLCVIRGIRHHAAFACTPEAQALRAWPEFARALNARAIMSDAIPDMAGDGDGDEVPYCIWYPETAAEETYRELARRYPRMAQQVARACAVAGYAALYGELRATGTVLPDVAVAEEARACGSVEIYEAVMREPVRYGVMDDYSRSIRADPQPSGLNGDTAVRPMLEVRQRLETPSGYETRVIDGDSDGNEDDSDDEFDMFPNAGFEEATFDITEDLCIDERASPEDDDRPPTAEQLAMAAYLDKPLPADLPPGNKDVLILAAAYSGDVDRYARLRRPRMVRGEAACAARGIYHNPFFATWWATTAAVQGRPEEEERLLSGEPRRHAAWVARAVHARMIMSNDLSRLTPATPRSHLPYLIWYPAVARPSTYREVARRVPAMRAAVLRAAVHVRDRGLFDELVGEVEPDPFVLSEARARDSEEGEPSYYTRRLLERADQLGLAEAIRDPSGGGRWGLSEGWKRFGVRPDVACSGTAPTGNWLHDGPVVVGAMQDPGIYNEAWADGGGA
ncbi:hypothetical protein ISF_05580 [Cordyceps fumosorosea ARSEF 2679]|uniref:Uncharacterized protein n=1 Tax=Cordyceps fumosorosea (strain ARSEF 2679) TaxID=1081104 RepID=A0A167UEC3_CORFA|nr:hypothetical protein ISF_05580 [Cordyceps fumosorosea ARSEF 2679]OAA61501.1 hypothetical protein ISF_05580 [Cordyceps fumosorosea ARSEF 2679]